MLETTIQPPPVAHSLTCLSDTFAVIGRQYFHPHPMAPKPRSSTDAHRDRPRALWHYEIPWQEQSALMMAREHGSVVTVQKRLPTGEVLLLAKLAAGKKR